MPNLKTTKQGFTITSSKEAAFTLIEILITITIIGIVFGVILTSASAIQSSSRDSQRQNDLRALQAALQQYYADQHFYPTGNQFVFGNALSFGTRTYMDRIPTDPSAGTLTPYCYVAQETRTLTTCDNSTVDCHYYELYADLENNTTGGLTCNSKTYDIRLTPL